jgi:hypothetical protein
LRFAAKRLLRDSDKVRLSGVDFVVYESWGGKEVRKGKMGEW